MGITGNLKTMALAELLQWLSQGQKTGTLVIDDGEVEKRVFFEKGMIVSSASTDANEYLGNFLVGHGYLTEEQVSEAVARQQEEKKLIGKILVELEAIPEDDLHQMLRLKAEESIYDIFTWEAGDFRFLDGELPEHTMIPMNLDVQWIVLEGSRRLDELTRIREYVPGPHCVAVAVADLGALDDLEEADARILSFVDDERTVAEISEEGRITQFMVSQALAHQVVAGTVKVVRPRYIEVPVPAAEPAPSEAPQPAPPGYPQAAMPGYPPAGYAPMPAPGYPAQAQAAPAAPAPPPAPPTEAQTILEEAEASLRQGDLELALDTFRRAKTADGSGPEVESAVGAGEQRVREAIERDGVRLSAVPRLSCGMEKLTQLKISPQEGFMLTRVNGSYDLKSLLKMHPAPQIDTQLLFWKLKKSGHVAF